MLACNAGAAVDETGSSGSSGGESTGEASEATDTTSTPTTGAGWAVHFDEPVP